VSVTDLDLSDHYAQIVTIPTLEFNNTPYRIKKRKFNEDNTQEFHYLLNQITWQEVYGESEINDKFSAFMDAFLYCYNSAFPIKIVHMGNTIKNNWITQGIKISSKRMRLLDKQRKTTIMEKKDLEYIDQYKKIYKRLIQEAKKLENENYISSSKNKVKATWQLINKELGKSFINNKNIELKRKK